MTAHEILTRWWSATNAEIKTCPSTATEIAAIEAHHGVTLPDDFRAYLLAGTPTFENWDAEDGYWWPINRITSIAEGTSIPLKGTLAKNASKHLLFLDYHDFAWAWAVSCTDDGNRGRIALISGRNDGYVANSFDAFVELYTSDWKCLSRVKRFFGWR